MNEEETKAIANKEIKDSFVKSAMRNMVAKKGISLWHFFLTTLGLFTFLIAMSYLTR
jgi:hypothetical protein